MVYAGSENSAQLPKRRSWLSPRKAAALAKEAFKTGKTIRQLCEEQNILPADELKKALDPWSMTEPG